MGKRKLPKEIFSIAYGKCNDMKVGEIWWPGDRGAVDNFWESLFSHKGVIYKYEKPY